jgi:hypothetical protein
MIDSNPTVLNRLVSAMPGFITALVLEVPILHLKTSILFLHENRMTLEPERRRRVEPTLPLAPR